MIQQYKKLNNVIGWLVFAIAAFTYLTTIEPTSSFWDCGEYISTSVKLQVGHPPGAPLFQLVGNFFSHFAMGDVTQQALMVNIVSALSSAFTILFLFWTITALAKKMALKDGELNVAKMYTIFGSGAVGALAYTFSDSFWFSATEGEVYAMSSFFTAVAYWAVLKWEAAADTDPKANKWLLFIAFLVGLSVGVHILVFLTIPAIAMIYYFKKFEKVTTGGFIIANIVALLVLGVIFKGIIPLVLNLFGSLEIVFVNTLGLPFNSGTIFAFLLIATLVVIGLSYTKKKNFPLFNQAILGFVFLMIGYSSFVVLAIRSNANTPIDENNPEDALSLLNYYNRVQYGDWPILYGKSFNAEYDPTEPFKDGKPIYKKDEEKGRYVVTDDNKNSIPNYKDSYKGFFPRMWSEDPNHIKGYVQIAGIKDKSKRPTLAQNLKFFFKYQLGKMYFRYFMWNFAGRQNDEQHRYELTKGNWVSGINVLDEARLGPQNNLPPVLKNNKARNHYYLLPLLLGIWGLIFQYQKDKKDFWSVLLFFLFTGVAVVLYTNHKPFEPRERDYAFVGSFYVFAIWIGLGVWGLFEVLKAKMKTAPNAIMLSVGLLVLVPGIMAKENWDDHDRSNRYTARDMAKAYLDSCEKNAILFTNGDNDTFPLWYVQEVEGYRTDVRVVNLSLLNTDWYIDQMKRKAYDGDPVPLSFERDEYQQGTNDVLYYRNTVNGTLMVDDFLNYVKSGRKDSYFQAFPGSKSSKDLKLFPTKKIRVPIDKESVLANGVVSQSDSALIPEYIDWTLNTNVLSKRDLMVVDLVTQNAWDRPIYFAVTVGNNSKSFFWLDQYFSLEGLAYRFTPIAKTTQSKGIEFGVVDTEKMYDNIVNKFEWGNMEDPDVYLDETNRRLSYNLRSIMGRLASSLAKEGKKDKALAVCDLAMEKMTIEQFGYSYFLLSLIDGYYKAGGKEQGDALIEGYISELEQELAYFAQFSQKDRVAVSDDWQSSGQYFQMLIGIYQENGASNEEVTNYIKRYNAAITPFR